MWIARDKDGKVTLYDSKPCLDEDIEKWQGNQFGYRCWSMPSFICPEITFENSPREVEFKFSTTGADRGHRDSIVRGLKRLEEDYMLSYEEEIEWLNKLVK